MGNFVVTYRTKDGSFEEVGYIADDRKSLFRQLSIEGRVAVRVREGMINKSPHKASYGIKKCVLVCLALATIIVIVCIHNFFNCIHEIQPTIGNKSSTIMGKYQKGEIETVAESRSQKIKRIKTEVNEIVKPFIKKADTNNVLQLGEKPLDPNDPDNALRTQTMTEVQMLIGITPGEPMPPVPFTFMLEDTMIEEAEKNGEKVVSIDNGNQRFIEEMKKWKITVKDTDTEQRAAKKMELIETQLDLMDGIEQGISVNDSIRAAWEFRKKAYESRVDLMKTITELHESDPDVNTTKELVKKANEHLEKDGILPITIGEILPELEEEQQ